MIDGAKMQFAMDHHATNGTIVTMDDLLKYFPHNEWPQCPNRGEYTVRKIGEAPACSYPDHSHYQ